VSVIAVRTSSLSVFNEPDHVAATAPSLSTRTEYGIIAPS